jgi:hypothetical protein
LVEAGKHLRFYARHARVPGQSLIVPLDRLLADHWATLLSPPRASQPRLAGCADRAAARCACVRVVGQRRADSAHRAGTDRGHRPSDH